MTQISFVAADGSKTVVEANDGDTVMQVALEHGVDGITAECGGAMMCSTCHVYIDDAWLPKVGGAPEDELDMLGFASCEVRDNSRLSCQVKVSNELAGLVVHLPESQV